VLGFTLNKQMRGNLMLSFGNQMLSLQKSKSFGIWVFKYEAQRKIDVLYET
jgi:hypothetical protein